MTANRPASLSAALQGEQSSIVTRANIGVLLAIVFADATSYSLILPVLPGLVRELGGDAALGGLLLGLHAFASFASAPLLGAASDRVGSRAVLIFTLFGAVTSQIMLGLSSTLGWVVISRVLGGAMAGNLGVVQASLAREGSINQASQRMAWLTATWAIGLVCGPALGVLLANFAGVPMFTAAISAAGATAIMAFVTIATFRPNFTPRPRGTSSAFQNGLFWRFCPVLFVIAMCQTGLVGVSGFHMQAVFGWSSVGIGAMLSISAAAILMLQLTLVQPAITLLGEAWVSICACICVVALLGLSAFWMGGGVYTVLWFAAVFGIITVAQTGVSSLIARHFDAGVHGTVFGSANAVSSAGRIVGPVLFGQLYGGPVGVTVFIFAALLIGATSVFMLFAVVPAVNGGVVPGEHAQ